ncbi:MAG: cation:proton antiporter [Pseudomonadota bacterium]
MHVAHADVLAFLLLLLGSLLMPLVSSKVRVPAAVLLIVYGLVAGPAALDLLHDSKVVSFLHEIGFVMLLFLAGLEIDFNGVRSRGPRALLGVVVICLSIMGLAFGVTSLLQLSPVYGLALGATSIGLPVAVLKESGRLRSDLGQTVLLVGSVGEFLTLVGMTLLDLTARHGFSFELVAGLARLTAIFLVAGGTLRIFMAVAWWQPERFGALVEAEHGSEIGVRAALVLMMAFSALALLAGVEAIVGAFLAGTLIAFVLRGKRVLEEKLTVVGYGLFIPLFFIVVGLRFDVRAVSLRSLLLAGELLVAAFAVRLLPSLLLLRQGLSVRDMLSTASLLSAPLTLMVAIAVLGRSVGLVGQTDVSALVVLAILTGVVFPVLYRLIDGAHRQPASAPFGNGHTH